MHHLLFCSLGDPDVHFAGLIVLNAKTMREIGRAEFCLNGPAPKPLHGCFSTHKGKHKVSLASPISYLF